MSGERSQHLTLTHHLGKHRIRVPRKGTLQKLGRRCARHRSAQGYKPGHFKQQTPVLSPCWGPRSKASLQMLQEKICACIFRLQAGEAPAFLGSWPRSPASASPSHGLLLCPPHIPATFLLCGHLSLNSGPSGRPNKPILSSLPQLRVQRPFSRVRSHSQFWDLGHGYRFGETPFTPL